MLREAREYTAKIILYILVCISNDCYTTGSNEIISGSILGWRIPYIMRIAIQFDGQFSFWTIEVNYIPADAILPSKAKAMKLFSAKF